MTLSLFQEAEAIVQKIKQQQYADLLVHDQLLTERREQKVFLHFGEITAALLPPQMSLLGNGCVCRTGKPGWRSKLEESKLKLPCLFQRKKRSRSHPPTDLKDSPGTNMPTQNRRRQG